MSMLVPPTELPLRVGPGASGAPQWPVLEAGRGGQPRASLICQQPAGAEHLQPAAAGALLLDDEPRNYLLVDDSELVRPFL